MNMHLIGLVQPVDVSWLDQANFMNGAIGRLLLACLLGGLVGLERETRRKAAGVRTNLLIALGCAFFTMLSIVLAGDGNADKSRVASNIVQGIGFLGAGLILHNRNRVSGMTSAASIFAVASIGMACGAGLYAPAGAATLIVILALELVGFMEQRFNLKMFPQVYEARGNDASLMMIAILDAMDREKERLTTVDQDVVGDVTRLSFVLNATKTQHMRLQETLKAESSIKTLLTFHDPEEE
jgi:putative Mg2+ transporter-C (MgtC) family protein